MNRRLVLGVVALAALVTLAGCSVLGPGEPDAEALGKNVTYDWETDANATIDVNDTRYEAVYRVRERSSIELYERDALGTEHPLDIEGLKFQFQNGTVRNLTSEDVELTRRRMTVSFAEGNVTGRLAFSAPRNGKSFGLPTFVSGSYDVTLPASARVDVPILAQVSPGGYETTMSNDRVTLSWTEVDTRSFSIRWYLERDLWLFGGLLVLALLLGGGGALYYLRQIRELEDRRAEVGLDVDTDDDVGDDGPPPGMR
jgi:predicted small lipoprotein YifL